MWMCHWGHPTAKRTLLVSNSEQIARLDKGKLDKSKREATFKTATTYEDKQGKKRFKGTAALRSTQTLWYHFFHEDSSALSNDHCFFNLWGPHKDKEHMYLGQCS